MERNHFIIVGRTSDAIAEGILAEFGPAQGLVITEPGNVIQSRFGTFGGGESIFELFVNGKLPDHPIEQTLSETQRATVERNLRGAHVTIVHSTSGENTSSRANSLLDGIYDLKSNYHVGSITLVSPHIPFLRNDRRFRKINADGTIEHQRNAVSGRNYARRLRGEGLDRVVGFEAHSRDGVKHYRDFFEHENSLFPGRTSVDFVNTAEFFAEQLSRTNNIVNANGDWQIACGSPDGLNKPKDYGIMRAKRFGIALYANTAFSGQKMGDDLKDIPWMYGIHKERIDDKTTAIMNFHGDVSGKDCIIIDDIFSSGSTTIHAAEELRKRGARSIRAVATHGVLPGDGLHRILSSEFLDEVHMTDTVTSVIDKAEQAPNGRVKLFIHSVSPLVNYEIAKDHKLQEESGLSFRHETAEVRRSFTPHI